MNMRSARRVARSPFGVLSDGCPRDAETRLDSSGQCRKCPLEHRGRAFADSKALRNEAAGTTPLVNSVRHAAAQAIGADLDIAVIDVPGIRLAVLHAVASWFGHGTQALDLLRVCFSPAINQSRFWYKVSTISRE
jgi:hypothetical protein